MIDTKQNAPTEGRSACVNFAGFARQRIAASRRMEPMPCGCRDPWLCRCRDTPVMRPDAIIAASQHLSGHGLAPRRTA